MPVSFFIDPSIADDRNLADVTTITLSYTFFRAEDQSAAARVEQAFLETYGGVGANTVDQSSN